MKRIAYFSFAVIVVLSGFVTFAAAQSDSLADFARAARKEKKEASKKFDNDNLPKTDKLSVVGRSELQPAEKSAESTGQVEHEGEASAEEEAKADQDAEKKGGASRQKPASVEESKDRDLKNQEWKDKIAEQQHQLDIVARELDVIKREYQLRAAAFYADAGNRLRNQGTWDKEDAQYKKQISEKEKELATANQHLEDLKEQARKADVPASMRE